MDKDFNNLDGVVDFDAVIAMSPVRGNPPDADNFYPADGDAYDYDNATGDPYATFESLPSFSNAIGNPFSKENTQRRRDDRKANKLKRQDRKDIRVKSKGQAKMDAASAQKAAAESLGKESQSDIELAKALAGGTTPPVKEKSNTGLIIGVVAVLVLGAVGFIVYKKMKGNKLNK